jgi:TPR repeat protein
VYRRISEKQRNGTAILRDRGIPRAQHNLGLSYAEGLGVPLGYGEGLVWLRKAADQDNAHAPNYLGVLYDMVLQWLALRSGA